MTVIRGALGGGCSEIFLGVEISNMKPHSNENVWIPKQNLEIETEFEAEILDNYSNRYITGLTQSRAFPEARAHSPRLHRFFSVNQNSGFLSPFEQKLVQKTKF